MSNIEEIGLKLLELNNELERIKKNKHKLENVIITKHQACCPDVCATINELKDRIDNEIEKISFTEKANTKRIKTAPAQFRESLSNKNKLRSNKAIHLLEIRINELNELKKSLYENNICKC